MLGADLSDNSGLNDCDRGMFMPQPSSHPRSPRHGRATSPMRPKARRALEGRSWPTESPIGSPGGGFVDEFESDRRRRSSPMPFNPSGSGIQPRPGPLQLDGSSDDWDGWHSMAGQMNAHDLRHAAQEGFDPEPMIKACVKVFVTQVTPSYSLPWARGEETRSTGSGFVVELPSFELTNETVHSNAAGAAAGCRCIVTNAHVVENFSLVQVRPAGSAKKYVARVMVIGHDCDLALLHVEDEAFWDGLPLVALRSGLPRLASEVVAVGFPVGGDDVSATRGVVSRILVGGLTDNLCVQIDAAINPGNSGGPVFDSTGKLVGVAFSGLMNANNVGYIIPLAVLHSFILNFRRSGVYTGKCSDCFEIQSMENETLRRRFGLSGKASGVMLSRIPPESSVHGVLKVRDILMEVDGIPIANDGTIQLPGTQDLIRVTFSYLVYRAPRGHLLHLTVLRQQEELEFDVEARPQPELLLICKQPLPKPSYLVVGGLVFVPLMSPYEALVPRRKLDAVLRQPAFEGEQMIVLLMVLRSEVNVGYEELLGLVEAFNGEPVLSLVQLKGRAEATKDGNLQFRLESGEMIVMSARKCWESEASIFRTHRIPHRASPDLR